MRLGLNLGYWGMGNDADNLVLAREADRLGYAVVWAAEAYGSDAATVLTWIAAQTERIDVGSAVFQIHGRTPANTAMTAATLDTLSGGRFRLGLGVSGPQVSEGWHGVRFDKLDGLHIGPRRAVPLSLLAAESPAVMTELARQVELQRGRQDDSLGEFVVLGRPPRRRLDPQDQEVLDRLAAGPQALAQLVSRSRAGSLLRRRVEDLEHRGLLRRAGFTPTDALHVLGRFSEWNVEAARLGATLLAQRAGMTVEALCELIVERFAQHAATELVTKILEDEIGEVEWPRDTAGAALLRYALNGHRPDAGQPDLGCMLTLRRPLVAIGAPVAAYLPQVAAALHTELVIPPHAEVANAVGAVSGSIIQRRQVIINPLDEDGTVRLHLPDGVHDFTGVEAAVEYAQAIMPDHVTTLARQAGAEHVEVRVARHDQTAMTKGGFMEIYLGSELSFIAAGRPSPARGNGIEAEEDI